MIRKKGGEKWQSLKGTIAFEKKKSFKSYSFQKLYNIMYEMAVLFLQ